MADVRRLPVPVTDIWEWQMRAACRGIDSAVFFHPDNERGSAKHVRDARAKRICAGCPVLEACRRHALKVQEPYGVWGGLTVDERESVLQRRTSSDVLPAEPRAGDDDGDRLPPTTWLRRRHG